MIVSTDGWCPEQPNLLKPCDYAICKYGVGNDAGLNSKYDGLYVKFYGNGQFEFLNTLYIKKGVKLDGERIIVCDFGKWSADQPLCFINYQDFIVGGRQANGFHRKLLNLRFEPEDINGETHQIMSVNAVWDFDSNFNVKFYGTITNKGYTFPENTYIELSGQIFTTNFRRWLTFTKLVDKEVD